MRPPWFVIGMVLVLSACNGPSGPGAMVGRVSGERLGAVVLEIQGAGIQGFSARGSTQLYAGRVDGRDDVHRVILVDAVGGELGFEMAVDDLGMETPVVTLVTAARTDDFVISVGGIEVTLER